jgi:hypothetical protein
MKTISEELFEKFLVENNLHFEKIATATTPRPDYVVKTGDLSLVFELKELTRDENFKITMGEGLPPTSKRIIGDHVRSAISDAKKQVQFGTRHLGLPSILLIYNKIDPSFGTFGTEDHDFTTAMYGGLTVPINRRTGAIEGGKLPLGRSRWRIGSAVELLDARGGTIRIKSARNRSALF